MKNKVTAEKLIASAWQAMAASSQVEEKIPDGWHTSGELSRILNKSRTRMGEILKDALDNGKCERKEFRIRAAGTIRPVPHYRLK